MDIYILFYGLLCYVICIYLVRAYSIPENTDFEICAKTLKHDMVTSTQYTLLLLHRKYKVIFFLHDELIYHDSLIYWIGYNLILQMFGQNDYFLLRIKNWKLHILFLI